MNAQRTSTTWRVKLHQAEPRIAELIKSAPMGDLLAWDLRRANKWDGSEADAKFILTECVPILERHALSIAESQ